MNAYSRTLHLPGGQAATSPVAVPVRERGASALDDRSMWAPPDPASMVLDPWGAPAARSVIRTVVAPWPAPDPALRVDMAPPVATPPVEVDIVEPFHPIDMPDVVAAQRAALAPSVAAPAAWPPPTIGSAAGARLVAPPQAPTAPDRSGVSRRLAIGLAAVAGTACAAVAAAVALL